MNRIIIVLLVIINVVCLAWLTLLLKVAPATAKPLEGLIANRAYGQVVTTGVEIVSNQANDFYYPSVFIIIINICVLFKILMSKG